MMYLRSTWALILLARYIRVGERVASHLFVVSGMFLKIGKNASTSLSSPSVCRIWQNQAGVYLWRYVPTNISTPRIQDRTWRICITDQHGIRGTAFRVPSAQNQF